ncbi:transmembrane and coiled-coil domain-containing protein 3 isoform X6 [Suricata suricatta]|uniref:transmembrane and coiled-coil domain-containing protein 3 isoform X6 n=1 Tax=Suricata suricatta TaxID=37032 RepID=UPI0011560807|nr:transmembrane and coiled-coil domain-containing protein 3 isoform X6 [Suricata suricatta]XP_029792267.1 transmembrane and coiled-coil domain-containing protein 3 isoform X6 [Suricata suricatta]
MKVFEKNYFWMLLPLLRLIADAAEHEEVAKHAIKLHRGRAAATTQRRQWVLDSCRKLSGLLRQKAVVLNKLKSAIRAVEKDVSLSDEEKLFQVHTFEIFQKELNESENSVFQAIYGLQRALQGDYRDVVNMKESSRQRLEALREAAIKEETEYVELLAAEKHQAEALKNMQHQNKSLSMLDEILEDVRKAADRLEEEIEEHAFDDNKSVKGVNFEAVLRVEEEEANSKQNLTRREVEDDLGLSMLIDSQNNRYILTKPRDATIPRADHHFLKDIVTIGMLSLPCGWLCTAVGLPTMFGYIVCGVLLGPSGLNSIKSVVQVETLGEVGVFFTLFLVGLEFSPERLRKVWKIALQGPCYMTLLMIAFGLLWGHLLHIRPTQSVFISTCLSLSSTPLVSRFLVGSARGEKEAGDVDYSAVLLGMLVVQDVQLGLFIAGLPTLIQAGAGAYSSLLLATNSPRFASTEKMFSSTVLEDIVTGHGLCGAVLSFQHLGSCCLSRATDGFSGKLCFSKRRIWRITYHCHGDSADPGLGWSDSFLAGCCFSSVSCYKDLPHWTILSETAYGEQREQRNPYLRNLCFHLFNVNGHGAAGRVHGAGLLPGRSAHLFPGPHGHRGDRVLHGAHP